MNNEIKKWIFDFEDDHYEKDKNCIFIGTEEDFDELMKIGQELWGVSYFNIRKEDPTDDELKEYWDWH